MAEQLRPRKRVHAIRRAPDGSAFKECESCGLSVAIALADMHECEQKKHVKKKVKTNLSNGKVEKQNSSRNVKKEKMEDQPRSAFRFFAEKFMKTCKDGNEVEIDRKAFETWKSMSKEERQPFILQAYKLNSAYEKRLREEENKMQSIEDEATSAKVGIYDESSEGSETYYSESGSSDGSGFFLSESNETFDTQDQSDTYPWVVKRGP